MVDGEDAPYNTYRALSDVDVDTNFAFAHYEIGLATQRAAVRGRQDGFQVALNEYSAVLRIVAEYFEKAEEYDKMFVMLRRPREYRAEDMRMLEARTLWRTAEVYESVNMTEQAREQYRLAAEAWPDVERLIAAEEGSPG
jgi:tetratricopeptide (TPR) repeat protein